MNEQPFDDDPTPDSAAPVSPPAVFGTGGSSTGSGQAPGVASELGGPAVVRHDRASQAPKPAGDMFDGTAHTRRSPRLRGAVTSQTGAAAISGASGTSGTSGTSGVPATSGTADQPTSGQAATPQPSGLFDDWSGARRAGASPNGGNGSGGGDDSDISWGAVGTANPPGSRPARHSGHAGASPDGTGVDDDLDGSWGAAGTVAARQADAGSGETVGLGPVRHLAADGPDDSWGALGTATSAHARGATPPPGADATPGSGGTSTPDDPWDLPGSAAADRTSGDGPGQSQDHGPVRHLTDDSMDSQWGDAQPRRGTPGDVSGEQGRSSAVPAGRSSRTGQDWGDLPGRLPSSTPETPSQEATSVFDEADLGRTSGVDRLVGGPAESLGPDDAAQSGRVVSSGRSGPGSIPSYSPARRAEPATPVRRRDVSPDQPATGGDGFKPSFRPVPLSADASGGVAAQSTGGQRAGGGQAGSARAGGPGGLSDDTAEQVPVRATLARPAETLPLDARHLRHDAKRRGRQWWLPVIIAVLILAAGYAAACFYFADRVPKGTVVAGSQIGGLTATEATAKLESDLADRSRQPVQAAAGDQTVSFDPVVAGLGFSAAETVNSVTGLDFRPAWLWRQITGLGEVRPVLQVNSQALESEIAQLASQVRIAPVDATLAVTSGQVVATEPANGTDLDATTAASYVKESYLVNPGPWDLPTEVRAPRIGQAELDRATAEIAQPVLSAPVSVTVGTATVELPVASFAPAALIQAPTGSDELELTWDATLLAAAVNQRLPEGLVTNPVDARFVFTGDQVAIEDGAPGTELDATALAGAMTPAAVATGAARTANALLREVDPAAGRAELEKMGVKEVVGRFETQATNDADRTRNLRKAAEMVTGTLIPPGETFSLDKALGHRALETGWFNAGVVIGGLSREGIGGGLSQFSTTLYNASHLAGMVDVAHVPHANYFSRYPTGREATLWEGQIDNQFKNDTPYGVVLRAGVTSSLRVWVELWSTKYWTVEAQIGQPYSYVAPRTIESRAADCQPQSAGSSGFQVDYWRIRTDPDGKAQAQENWHWRYDPMNAVVCLETP